MHAIAAHLPMLTGQESERFFDPADSSAASYGSHNPDKGEHPINNFEPLEDPSAVHIDFKVYGTLLSRIYVWVSEAKDIVAMGKRQWVQLYIIRPDLIKGQTLDQFGAEDSVTRQGMNKLVQEFRATFGIRGRNMRSDETRLQCQKSHQR